jgi:hypothetical protein
MSRRLLISALAATAVACCAPTAPAGAKPPPRSFYGAVPQTWMTSDDYSRMHAGHIGSLRIMMSWSSIDPVAPVGDYDFATTDSIVAQAANAHVRVVPFLYGTPDWVARKLDGYGCSPCDAFAPRRKQALAAWRQFAAALVARYGRGGDFWLAHPELRTLPIRTWQIWNEQNSRTFFAPKAKPRRYAKLLRSASRAVKSVDRSANVVLGGMAQLAGSRKAKTATKYLQALYRIRGIERRFDGVAVHPYGAKVRSAIGQVNSFRDRIEAAHDRHAQLWITEMGWSSAARGNPLNVGRRGQARRLKQAFTYLERNRHRLNLRAVMWFSLADSKTSICQWCRKSGLLKPGGGRKPAWRAFTRFSRG